MTAEGGCPAGCATYLRIAEQEVFVRAEQAIFTSLPRRGRGGYHLVSRSRGISAADAQALSQWAPSHGALIVDASNRTSVNFHPLPSGLFALSRTCAGPPEYSGRGGSQLYTHFLIISETALQASGFQPLAIYRDAVALGYLLYDSDPAEVLEPVLLSQLHPKRDAAATGNSVADLDMSRLTQLHQRLQAGHSVRFAYDGDRIGLAECLVGQLSPEAVRNVSFSTSLVPSADRAFLLALVNEISNGHLK
jgi:hypothetical protein